MYNNCIININNNFLYNNIDDRILKKRQDLKVIIASATLDVETFYNFYNNNRTDDSSKDNVAIISVEGRNYPIDIMYLKEPCDNYINKAIETALKIHISVW